MDNSLIILFRLFFAVATAVGLVFIYAAAFNRDLPPRIAVWFFGTLSGQPVTIHRPSPEPKLTWPRWISLTLISAVPPAAWIVVELLVA